MEIYSHSLKRLKDVQTRLSEMGGKLVIRVIGDAEIAKEQFHEATEEGLIEYDTIIVRTIEEGLEKLNELLS